MRQFLLFALGSICLAANASESVCFGTTDRGRLEGGVELPESGPNFVSYGGLPQLLGRTYVHSKVRDVVVDAYKALETELPETVFKYAETGLKAGGKFKPHKTHQNGLSIDFIVPVVDQHGKSVHLPTHAINKYGYGIEFDDKGIYGSYRIDFDTMAAHIVALYKSAKKNHIGIWRILFDPQLQPLLYKTKQGQFIKDHIEIPSKKSWVRHDEHYHVDFKVACQPM